jgi:hypothetical protein
MKKYFLFAFIFSLAVFVACKKEAGTEKMKVITELDIPTPCPGGCTGGGVPTPLTDEQLESLGIQVGCKLAQLRRVDLFNATTALPNAPEIYKEGVRNGWTSCYSHGTPIGTSNSSPYGGVFCNSITTFESMGCNNNEPGCHVYMISTRVVCSLL